MRRTYWLSFILLCCLALVQYPAMAADSISGEPAGGLILYDSAPPYGWAGELHALHIANLLGHFPLEYTIEPVEGYAAGEIEDYAVTFYIGDTYDNPLPEAFLADVMSTDRTVCWFKYNLWQIAWDDAGVYWDPEFTFRYGFQFDGMDASGFSEVQYKGESLVKNVWDPDVGKTLILDPEQAEVKAVAYRPGTHPDGEASTPYVVHAGNLWYFADTPLTYVSEEDRYLVLCDLLHDIVGIDHAPSRRALIRIEDVDPTCDPKDLKAIATYLHLKDIPFQVAVIPVYANPLGVENGGVPEVIRLSESPQVVEALHYMVARGGQIILHGYTHQYDETRNPYNGLTGDDCEFFLSTWNDQDGHTELLGPVPEDSVAWVNDRIDRGLSELSACGLSPVAWEVPHYVASALDYTEFGRRFDLNSGRMLYFNSTGDFLGQFYPYPIEQDIYGQRIMPENLGNVEPEAFYDYPPRFPADIVNAAAKNRVVRDAWASSYFHSYLGLRYLRQVVEGIEKLDYIYTSIPPLSADAGPDKTIVAGGSATLEGSASDGTPPYSYSWTPETGLDNPGEAQPAASPASTTVYTLTVTDDEGRTAVDLVTVTVLPPVVAEAGPDKTIAAGDGAMLGGSAVGGVPPYAYSWSPATGLSDTSASQPIASPAGTTTYTLTVTDDYGQTDSDTVTVTIATLVVADAGSDRLIAFGGSAVLDGSASGGLDPYSYSWSPSAGLNDPNIPQPTVSPAGTTTYTLTVTDDLGQTDTDTVTVTVAPPVVAEAGLDTTVASGGSTVLQGAASGGLPPYSYSWSPSTGLNDPRVAQPTASPTETVTYTLTVTDELGQTDKDAVTVTVASGVVAEAGSDTTIASGESTILQGSASGGLQPYTYSWSPSTGLSNPSIAQPAASPTSTVTYTITVRDHLGQTDIDTVTVTVLPLLLAHAGPDRAIMPGDSTTLDGSGSGGVPPYSYAWSPTTGLSDPSAPRPVASPTTTTTYTLTVTDDYGKTDTDSATVTVATGVAADAGPDTTVASGGSTVLQGSASGGVPPYTYSWSPTTGLSSPNVAKPTATPTSATTYTLTVTDDLGQSDTDSVAVTMLSEVFSDVPEGHWASDEIAACVNAGIVSGYTDGQYHGDWPVDRAQMAVYIARAQGWVRIGDDMTSAPELFPDVPTGYWAGVAIEACVEYGISSGYIYPDPDNPGATIRLYEPAGIVTRDQMAVYMARSMADPVGENGLADYVPTDPRNFPDVPDTGYGPDGTEPFWAYRHIEYCVEHGVVNGYDDGLYHPDWDVTRDQMAAYIARAFDLGT